MITQIDRFMKHKTLSPRLHTLLTDIKVDLKLREEAKEEHRLRVVELEKILKKYEKRINEVFND